MWQLDYTPAARNYFLDNDPYSFDLLIKIEELKFTSTGIPAEGCTQIEDGLLWWETLNHAVIYERLEEENQLVISAIKPL
ncbi:MAG: hypothetical protein NT075_37380 [Chloroflexi bacterium]|nr:hypothetical protein [Chloroflexota bacterium]